MPTGTILDESLLKRAQQRLAHPAFAAAAARLRGDVAAALSRPVQVPPPDRPAGYYHDYFCPDHGIQLIFDWETPHAHRCPVDGAIHRGERYDRAWWWFVNNAQSEGIFRLALAWRLEGNVAARTRAHAIFDAYVAGYPQAGFPKEDTRSRQGKVAFSALDEAVWLIPLTWAYRLIQDTLSADTQRRLEKDLFEPAAEHLVRQRWLQVHNYMCWLNAGVAASATLVGRDDLVTLAVDSPFGLRRQSQEGVLPDGTWWEASASYHFYTLAAILSHLRSVPASAPAEAWHVAHRMYRAPLRWAFPDLVLPALNDCWYHSSLVREVGHGIPTAAAFYEMASGWFGDQAFAGILSANYAPVADGGAGNPRDSLEALLYGPESVSPLDVSVPPTRLLGSSHDLPELGAAVLRGPRRMLGTTDGRTYLMVKYGAHGGSHGHPDKLSLILGAGGERVSPDLGTPGYGIAINDSWYRHTLSHNTVLLDGERQPPAEGHMRQYVPPSRRRTEHGVVDVEVAWPAAGAPDTTIDSANGPIRTPAGPYAGAQFRRVILWRPEYFLDLFLVRTPQPRRIEWAYHQLGNVKQILRAPGPVSPENDAVAPVTGGVPPFVQVRQTFSGERDLMLDLATKDAVTSLWLCPAVVDAAASPETSLIAVADAPANPASVTMPLVLRRNQASRALYASVFAFQHPQWEPQYVRSVRWAVTGEGLVCTVRTNTGIDRWIIGLPAGVAAPAAMPTVPPDRELGEYPFHFNWE